MCFCLITYQFKSTEWNYEKNKNIEASRTTIAEENRNRMCLVEVSVTFFSTKQRYTQWP